MFPTIETIPLRQMASGDILSLQVYKFIGSQPGKKVYIQSNLHGAEIAGNAVIQQLIDFLQTVNTDNLIGEIWLVPVCNPMGTNERAHHFSPGRYCVYEAKDWNRIFWDYEKASDDLITFAESQRSYNIDVIRQNYLNIIKQEFSKVLEKINCSSSVPYTEKFRCKLQSLSIDADYLIDLHSSTNQGLNYLYYFHHREDSAKYFLLDFGILLDTYDGDAFDEAFIKPWLALENSLKKIGRETRFDVEAWTLELGTGMRMNPNSVALGVRGIKNYLLQKGILANTNLSTVNTSQNINYEMAFKKRSEVKKYYGIAGGMIQSRVELGSLVKIGDCIYQILSFNKSGQLPTVINVYAEADGLVYDVSTNQAINEGEFVMGVIS
jgi:uncharacterized protein